MGAYESARMSNTPPMHTHAHAHTRTAAHTSKARLDAYVASVKAEVDQLQQEADMPIEKLLTIYKYPDTVEELLEEQQLVV